MWPFGRKKKQKTFSQREVTGLMRESWPNYDLTERHRKEWERFEKSAQKKTITRHFDLLARMQAVPAAEQEPLARDLVSIAGDVAAAFRAQEEMLVRHSREMKQATKKGTVYKERMPSHPGYKRLTIMLEKEGSHSEAIALCKKARSQGWSGDWDTRLARLETKSRKGQ
jgi:hypothetical protein